MFIHQLTYCEASNLRERLSSDHMIDHMLVFLSQQEIRIYPMSVFFFFFKMLKYADTFEIYIFLKLIYLWQFKCEINNNLTYW